MASPPPTVTQAAPGPLALKAWPGGCLGSTHTHHAELGLGLLEEAVLLRLCDADEDPDLGVELQDAALQAGDEVAKAPDAADADHGLQGGGRRAEGSGAR